MTITRQALAVNTEKTLWEITEHILFDFFNEYPIKSHISVPVGINDGRMCYHMRTWCRYTRGRFECILGFFSVPHHTARTRDHNDTHTTRQERETRQDEREETRQEGKRR